jgi:hypothetical protein
VVVLLCVDVLTDIDMHAPCLAVCCIAEESEALLL